MFSVAGLNMSAKSDNSFAIKKYHKKYEFDL